MRDGKQKRRGGQVQANFLTRITGLKDHLNWKRKRKRKRKREREREKEKVKSSI